MRRIIYVELPEYDHIREFYYRGCVCVNLCAPEGGIIKIVTERKEKKEKPAMPWRGNKKNRD